jgi:dTDP-4-dehydrorhamnose 3,5-epimerase
MGKVNQIQGVVLTPLKQIHHPLGNVFHGIKQSDNGFAGFEEAYFSTINYNVIKSWKKHLRMTLNIIVPVGEIEFIIYDDRADSLSKGSFMEVKLSQKNYQRVTIPSNLWMAFKGIGETTNLLLNISNLEHDPDEVERIDLDSINYNWS